MFSFTVSFGRLLECGWNVNQQTWCSKQTWGSCVVQRTLMTALHLATFLLPYIDIHFTHHGIQKAAGFWRKALQWYVPVNIVSHRAANLQSDLLTFLKYQQEKRLVYVEEHRSDVDSFTANAQNLSHTFIFPHVFSFMFLSSVHVTKCSGSEMFWSLLDLVGPTTLSGPRSGSEGWLPVPVVWMSNPHRPSRKQTRVPSLTAMLCGDWTNNLNHEPELSTAK